VSAGLNYHAQGVFAREWSVAHRQYVLLEALLFKCTFGCSLRFGSKLAPFLFFLSRFIFHATTANYSSSNQRRNVIQHAKSSENKIKQKQHKV
jgi:hypothetical protein